MKTRIVLGLAGAGMTAWGAWLALGVPQLFELGAWFVAGPVIHDALLAPVVAALGFVLRGPLKVGAVLSGALVLISVPLLWQDGVPSNPGLHDANYWARLGVSLGVVWVFVLVFFLVRKVVKKRRAAAAK